VIGGPYLSCAALPAEIPALPHFYYPCTHAVFALGRFWRFVLGLLRTLFDLWSCLMSTVANRRVC
jgi:hypothetical protein